MDQGTLTARFGELIRKCREKRDVSQRRLGQMAGVDQSKISRIESGELSPTLEVCENIAAALEMTVVLTLEPVDDEEEGKNR